MGKTLRADIVIGGIADNSFYQLGNALQSLGSQLNLVSGKLIQFGKESVEAYTSYEDAMLDTQVALRTQYETASELGKVMQQLDRAAMQWANDSRFTTEDVAGAISNAAHAGWDLEKILSGIPNAMNLSLAGSMELAEGLEYLVDISNSANIGFDDLGEFVDFWAYAANRSSTTIPELGQAMQKMGATMQFVKGDVAGLATMLAVLANNGTKGTDAGTLLRNSLIRLIAPTQKAAETMEGLELTADDLDDIYSNVAGLDDAAKMLQEAGFSAYDAQGNLKSFMTIWKELDAVTKGMSEQDRNAILSAIFPTRTITGALALLEAASEDWNGLYESIRQNAAGYADYAAETMESGLGGTLRHLESVYNALQTRTGNALAGDVGAVSEILSGMIETINGMDDAAFSGIVSGLEAVAVAGPGLMVAGGALKLIGAIAGTGVAGKTILLGTGLAALAAGMHSFNDTKYADQFGNLSLDADRIQQYTSSLTTDFAAAEASITKYSDAVNQAVSQYETATGSLKSGLMTAMLTDAALTSDDVSKFEKLGDDIREAVLSGIEGNYSSSLEFLGFLGDIDPDALDGFSESLTQTIISGYESAIATAEAMSNNLRDAMTSAFSDGKISDTELGKIQSYIDELNKLFSNQMDAENTIEFEKSLKKAQSLGVDGLQVFSDDVDEILSGNFDKIDTYSDNFLRNSLPIWNAMVENGQMTQQDRDENYNLIREIADNWKLAKTEDANKDKLKGINQLLSGSDLSDAFSYTGELSNMVMSGAISPENAHSLFKKQFGGNKYAGEFDMPFNGENVGTQIGRTLSDVISILGGQDAIAEQIADLQTKGDFQSAADLQQLFAMEQIANNMITRDSAEYAYPGGNKSFFESVVGTGSAYSIEDARSALEFFGGSSGSILSYLKDFGAAFERGDLRNLQTPALGLFETSALDYVIESIKGSYDFDKLLAGVDNAYFDSYDKDMFAAYRLLLDDTLNAEDYRIQVTPEVDKTPLEQISEDPVFVDIQPRNDGMGLEDLENQGVTVEVEGDTTTLSATIEAQDGQTLLAYIDGDPSQLSAKIYEEDGKTLIENVDGDTSALAAAIDQYNGRVITVAVRYASSGLPSSGSKSGGGKSGKFAEGGRATSASIFGEAGPEWAIPEQHTQRTAELLNAAREASGFTWPDLLSRNGGLNAGEKESWTLVYSPTIVAGDATGVEQKLMEDKNRLEKWLRDKKLHDAVEVYA